MPLRKRPAISSRLFPCPGRQLGDEPPQVPRGLLPSPSAGTDGGSAEDFARRATRHELRPR
eukprot:12746007-Alexandrium_andersonii.AAC.1